MYRGRPKTQSTLLAQCLGDWIDEDQTAPDSAGPKVSFEVGSSLSAHVHSWPGWAKAAEVASRVSAIPLAHSIDRLGNELLQHSYIDVTQAPNRQTRLSHLVLAKTGK